MMLTPDAIPSPVAQPEPTPVALDAPPSPIAVETGETRLTVYVAATANCRSCGRVFGALSRRLKPAEVPAEDAVRAAFVDLLASCGCQVGQDVRCSYCASAGKPTRRVREPLPPPPDSQPAQTGGRDMRSWDLRMAPENLPPAIGGWLEWDGTEADDDGL